MPATLYNITPPQILKRETSRVNCSARGFLVPPSPTACVAQHEPAQIRCGTGCF